jgi:anti-anti-sigma factor
MNITTNQADGKTVIRIEGDLLIASVAEAKPAIVAAIGQGNDILLDLRDVGECDTAGIQLLLMARSGARLRGKKLWTTIQSETFRSAVARVGIIAGCFEIEEGTA